MCAHMSACAYIKRHMYKCIMCMRTYMYVYIYMWVCVHLHYPYTQPYITSSRHRERVPHVYIYIYVFICLYTCTHTYTHSRLQRQSSFHTPSSSLNAIVVVAGIGALVTLLFMSAHLRVLML